MIDVYLALGSNVGDSQTYIAKATELLGESISDITQAPLYTSKAVGFTDQPDFYNTAISGKTTLAPEDLLTFVKDIEQQIGRIYRFRWGPREIDIDIILYGNTTFTSPVLTIPHERFRERDFVLRPLCDLHPEQIDPVTQQTIQALLQNLPASNLSIIS